MKWKIPIITLCFLLIGVFASAITQDNVKVKDSNGVVQLQITVDTSGDITFTPTATNPTLDFEDCDVTTSGSFSATGGGTPTWSLQNSQILDDGVTDSPYWGVQDANDQLCYWYKSDNSHALFYCDTAAKGFGFQAGNDTDDYFTVTTASNEVTLGTSGSCDLHASPSSDFNIMPDSDTSDYVSWSSSGTAITMGIIGGADLIITHDTDAKGIDFQLGNDTDDYPTLYTTGGASYLKQIGASDLWITSDNAAGEINIAGGGDVDDYVQFDAALNVAIMRAVGSGLQQEFSDDADDYITWTTASNIVTATIAGGGDLALSISGAYLDLTAGELKMANDEVIDNGTTDDTIAILSNDADTTVAITGYEAKEARLQLLADQDDNATDGWQLDVDTSGNLSFGNDTSVAGTFVDMFTVSAAGAYVFKGAPVDFTLGDAGAEDIDFIFDGHSGGTDWYITSDDSADDLVIGTAGPASATNVMYFDTNHHTTVCNGDATANAVEDVLTILKETSGTAAAGIGAGLVFSVEDETTSAEEQGSIDVVVVDATTTAEDSDFVFSQNTDGAVAETLRLVAAAEATTGDYLKFSSNTQETNAVYDVMVLTQVTGTGANNLGMSISFHPEDATGAEEHATMEVQMTDATRASCDTDIFYTQDVNGTLETRVLFDADGPTIHAKGTTPLVRIGDGGNEDISIDFDGSAQNYYIGVDEAGGYVDQLVIGLGQAVATTPAIAVDANQDVTIVNQLTSNGIINEVVVVTDAAEYDVTAANTGKVHVIGDLSQNTSIDLPAEAAGLYYKFIYVGAADDASDHSIDTEDDLKYFKGGVAFIDTDAGAGADEMNAGIYADADSNSILTINNISTGTVVEVYCDGTYWYVTGIVASDTAPAFSDQ